MKMKNGIIMISFIFLLSLVFAQDTCLTCIDDDPENCPDHCFVEGDLCNDGLCDPGEEVTCPQDCTGETTTTLGETTTTPGETTTITATTTPGETTTQPQEPGDGLETNLGKIILIAIGGLAVVLLIAIVVVALMKFKPKKTGSSTGETDEFDKLKEKWEY